MTPPPVAVTVMGYVPAAVLLPTAIVRVELPPPGAGIWAGLRVSVVPVGAPLADRLMALLNPPTTVVVMVGVAEAPAAKVTELGDAPRLKFGDAETWARPKKATGV